MVAPRTPEPPAHHLCPPHHLHTSARGAGAGAIGATPATLFGKWLRSSQQPPSSVRIEQPVAPWGSRATLPLSIESAVLGALATLPLGADRRAGDVDGSSSPCRRLPAVAPISDPMPHRQHRASNPRVMGVLSTLDRPGVCVSPLALTSNCMRHYPSTKSHLSLCSYIAVFTPYLPQPVNPFRGAPNAFGFCFLANSYSLWRINR